MRGARCAGSRASVADRAGLGRGDDAVDVLLEEEALAGEGLGGGADLRDVAVVAGIALLDRRARVAGGQAIGAGPGERDGLAEGVAQVGAGERGGAEAVAGVRGERDRDVRESDTRAIVAVGVGCGDEDRVGRGDDRRDDRAVAGPDIEDAVVEPATGSTSAGGSTTASSTSPRGPA